MQPSRLLIWFYVIYHVIYLLLLPKSYDVKITLENNLVYCNRNEQIFIVVLSYDIYICKYKFPYTSLLKIFYKLYDGSKCNARCAIKNSWQLQDTYHNMIMLIIRNVFIFSNLNNDKFNKCLIELYSNHY